jgi:hypothetical protein
MAKATMYQGDRRFPVKKVSLFTFLDVRWEIPNSNPKKQTKTINKTAELIGNI